MNLKSNIRRILQEETKLSSRILRRIPADEMEKEFIESFNFGFELTKKRRISQRFFKDEVIYTTIVNMMDSFHPIFSTTFGENEFWYDDIFNDLKEHYEERIIHMYNKKIGLKESLIKEDKIAKKKIQTLIDEFGLYEAARMLGISKTKIVELSNFPIDSEIANEILIENLSQGKLQNTYKKFIITSSMDGLFYWETNTRIEYFPDNTIQQITVAATPFWDGVNYTPVEIDWFTLFDDDMNIIKEISSEGGSNLYKKFEHQTNFDSVEELFKWYEETYLPGVYDIIMNTLLPKVKIIIDFELR